MTRKTQGELIAEGFQAINILREAVAWVEAKNTHGFFSPEWYEHAKKFLANPISHAARKR